jgi:hypothetical protein
MNETSTSESHQSPGLGEQHSWHSCCSPAAHEDILAAWIVYGVLGPSMMNGDRKWKKSLRREQSSLHEHYDVVWRIIWAAYLSRDDNYQDRWDLADSSAIILHEASCQSQGSGGEPC